MAQPWTQNEDIELFRKLVSTTLAARSQYYAEPNLAPWSSNSGDKINKKLQQMLRKLGIQIPGAGGVVDEVLAKMSKGKGKKEKTQSPEKSKSAETTPKKRKLGPAVKLEVEEIGIEYRSDTS